jgi:hypothetical protein
MYRKRVSIHDSNLFIKKASSHYSIKQIFTDIIRVCTLPGENSRLPFTSIMSENGFTLNAERKE